MNKRIVWKSSKRSIWWLIALPLVIAISLPIYFWFSIMPDHLQSLLAVTSGLMLVGSVFLYRARFLDKYLEYKMILLMYSLFFMFIIMASDNQQWRFFLFILCFMIIFQIILIMIWICIKRQKQLILYYDKKQSVDLPQNISKSIASWLKSENIQYRYQRKLFIITTADNKKVTIELDYKSRKLRDKYIININSPLIAGADSLEQFEHGISIIISNLNSSMA